MLTVPCSPTKKSNAVKDPAHLTTYLFLAIPPTDLPNLLTSPPAAPWTLPLGTAHHIPLPPFYNALLNGHLPLLEPCHVPSSLFEPQKDVRKMLSRTSYRLVPHVRIPCQHLHTLEYRSGLCSSLSRVVRFGSGDGLG